MSLTLPIVIGRKYVRRDGTVVTARHPDSIYSPELVFVGGSCHPSQLDHQQAYRDTGRVRLSAIESEFDLIADHIETAGHPHAALMLEYAQDAMKTAEPWKLWEVIRNDVAVTDTVVDLTDHPGWNPKFQYRRKPRTIRIGEFDVPEPLRDAVPDQADYWLAEITNGQARAVECCNFTPSTCLTHIASGVAHLTREAAEQHARALLSFTKQK